MEGVPEEVLAGVLACHGVPVVAQVGHLHLPRRAAPFLHVLQSQRGRAVDEVEHVFVDVDVRDLEPRPGRGEAAEHVEHLDVVVPGHLVVLLDAAAAERVERALQREAPDGAEPREGDPPRPQPVDLGEEPLRLRHQKVLELAHRELREPARHEQEVVLEEVVGADADDVERVGDDAPRRGAPDMTPETPLVLPEVLHLLPQRDH
uniref:Uncharacterized protein n=1 Tax=Arundo donax TaxID=35708 RepID=A0A0A9FKE6_ARUDO